MGQWLKYSEAILKHTDQRYQIEGGQFNVHKVSQTTHIEDRDNALQRLGTRSLPSTAITSAPLSQIACHRATTTAKFRVANVTIELNGLSKLWRIGLR